MTENEYWLIIQAPHSSGKGVSIERGGSKTKNRTWEGHCPFNVWHGKPSCLEKMRCWRGKGQDLGGKGNNEMAKDLSTAFLI